MQGGSSRGLPSLFWMFHQVTLAPGGGRMEGAGAGSGAGGSRSRAGGRTREGTRWERWSAGCARLDKHNRVTAWLDGGASMHRLAECRATSAGQQANCLGAPPAGREPGPSPRPRPALPPGMRWGQLGSPLCAPRKAAPPERKGRVPSPTLMLDSRLWWVPAGKRWWGLGSSERGGRQVC